MISSYFACLFVISVTSLFCLDLCLSRYLPLISTLGLKLSYSTAAGSTAVVFDQILLQDRLRTANEWMSTVIKDENLYFEVSGNGRLRKSGRRPAAPAQQQN